MINKIEAFGSPSSLTYIYQKAKYADGNIFCCLRQQVDAGRGTAECSVSIKKRKAFVHFVTKQYHSEENEESGLEGLKSDARQREKC